MNCKKCNAPLSEGAQFCTNCGEKVISEPVQTPAEPVINTQPVQNKKSSTPLLIGLIIGGVVVIGILVVVFVILFTKDGNNDPTVEPSEPSNPTEPTTVDPEPTYDDYMVVGDDTLGYLKLPGKWLSTKISGSADSSIQYIESKTYTGSTATGSWLVTLDVLDKTITTSAKEAVNREATYYRAYDSDATNIKIEQTTLGKYDAYKIYVQYKSDSVWVVSWFFTAEDGVVHMIQVEGLDLTKDYFEIPKTFSLTKIK